MAKKLIKQTKKPTSLSPLSGQCIQDIYIPGGHDMQPFVVSEEELVKVPTGHGSR